jgi:hypothetical protein
MVHYDGHQLRAFVAGRNFCDLPNSIPDSAVLVTYNGRRFEPSRLSAWSLTRVAASVILNAIFCPAFRLLDRSTFSLREGGSHVPTPVLAMASSTPPLPAP